MAKRKPTLKIDIRDMRLPGGRFTCSARTNSAPEFRRREAAVRSLIEAGAYDILARVKAKGRGKLHVGDAAAAVARGDLDSLRVARTSQLLLGATIDRLQQRKAATRARGTQQKVEGVARHLETCFGVVRKDRVIVRDVDMTAITTKECEAFLHGAKKGTPWAPRTQDVNHTYAKQVWQLAIDEEVEAAERENRRPRLRRNPWVKIDPATVIPTRVIFLRMEERDAMLAKLAGTPLRAFMAVAYHAGLRIGEAIHLRTDVDVDLDAGLLRVQSRAGEHHWTTKNKRNRDVNINRDLLPILRDHIASGFSSPRFFFRAPGKDRPLGHGTAWRWWTEAYGVAGIKHGRSEVDAVVYHTGRHTFASLLVQRGVSPLVVAELMGITYEEVIRTYGHLSPHNLSDAVRLLESTPLSDESSNAEKRKVR